MQQTCGAACQRREQLDFILCAQKHDSFRISSEGLSARADRTNSIDRQGQSRMGLRPTAIIACVVSMSVMMSPWFVSLTEAPTRAGLLCTDISAMRMQATRARTPHPPTKNTLIAQCIERMPARGKF